MKTEFRHISTSIRGLLAKPDRELVMICTSIHDERGRPYYSVKLLRWDLRFKLDDGQELLPDDRCDNFDPKRGCLGHKEQERCAKS
jgi:hypothetical protein